MTGSLTALGGGRWKLVVDAGVHPLTGRRSRRSKTMSGLSRKQAERALSRFEAMVAAERPTVDMTFGALLTAWLEQAELSPSTRREYSRLVERRIRPALGAVRLDRLDANTLDRFYRALTDDNLAPASVRQCHAIIRRALNQAVKWGLLERNVALLATPPRLRRVPVKPPSTATVRHLLDAAVHNDELYAAAWLAAGTGARRGEICALRWSDVNLELGTILIARSIARTGSGHVEKETKTYAERLVAIDMRTVGILADHRRRMELRAQEAGCTPETTTSIESKRRSTTATASTSSTISTRPSAPSSKRTATSTTAVESITPTSKPGLASNAFVISRAVDCSTWFNPDTLSGLWGRHAAANGAKGVRFHDLRHWSVTIGLDAGVPVAVIAERHGHANPNVTLGIYAHPVDGRARQAADVTGRALAKGEK